MCCCQDSKPIFKGVVVSTTTATATNNNRVSMVTFVCCVLGLLINNPLSVEAVNVDYQLTSSSQSNGNNNNNLPCFYQSQTEELDCVCPDDAELKGGTGGTGGVVRFPSADYLRDRAENNSVASLKLHSCRNLHLQLDLRPLSRPFYRLRVEDVENVTVDGIILAPNDFVDVWLRNVNGSLTVSGNLVCMECDANATAALKLLVIDTRRIDVDQVFVDEGSAKVKIQVRNADSLRIKDSYFKSQGRDSLEVFNVPQVEIIHSEFHNASKASVVVNSGVSEVLVENSIMAADVVETLDEKATKVSFNCTTAPDEDHPVDDPECTVVGVRAQSVESKSSSGSSSMSSGGAIVLAVVSAFILLAAVTVLIFLHRAGKLDQYL